MRRRVLILCLLVGCAVKRAAPSTYNPTGPTQAEHMRAQAGQCRGTVRARAKCEHAAQAQYARPDFR